MKKLLAYLLFFLCWLLFPSGAFGACSPPTDYSDCPIAQVGPQIAANIDPKNYQQIREQYNQASPTIAKQQIPVTLIYTTSDLSQENLQQTTANLEKMKQYGLHPVIRISSSVIGAQGWDRITPQEAQTAAQTLNRALSQIQFSQKPIVYFGNEPNLPEEWGGQADASSFAQTFASFIQAAETNRQFQIFIPPVAGHQEGAEYNFLQKILNYSLPNGSTIGQSVDGAALNIYNTDSQALSSLYQQLTQFYQQSGIGNFVISEIGPLVNGRLLQNQEDVDRWASIMSEVFRDIKNNPKLFSGAQFISTAFFLDVNGDGFPDRTLLVVIDEDGNVTIMELATSGGGILTFKKYGNCQADQPFLSGPITKGNSFEVKVTSCFRSIEDPSKEIQTLLKTLNLEFPNNQEIATHLHQETLKKLTPPSYTPAVQKKSALGKITYEVCEKGTFKWFNVENEVEFETPKWMNEMADSGEELAKMLLPPGLSGLSFKKTSLASSNPQEKVLGKTNNLLAQRHSYSMNISPQVTPLGGNNYSVCWSFQPQAEGCGLSDVSGNLSINIDGKDVYGGFWGPVRTVSGPYLCNYAPFPGPVSVSASPGSTISVCVNVSGVNHNCGEDPRPFLSGCVSCKIGPNGEVQGCGASPLPTPTPRMCEGYSPQGEGLNPQIVCVAGNCILKDRIGNPANSLLESLIQASRNAAQALQEVLELLPLCPTKTYIVTPLLQTPYTFETDNHLRTTTLSIFKVPTNDARTAFQFKHAIQNSTQGSKASPLTSYSSQVEIFGQAGVKNSYNWVQKALMPPRTNYSSDYSPKSSELTNIPFRDSSIVISASNREKVINLVLKSWENSKIKEQWEFVYKQATSRDWNPAFVIALWIEESGASGVDAYDLGCLGAPANNLSAQLDCLFSRPYADSSFEDFMCQYSEGKPAPCEFALNPNFPKNLEYWYRQLTND